MQNWLPRVKELLGIYRRPLIYLGLVAAVAVLVWLLWPRGPGLVEREIERQAERELLDVQTSALEERAREAEAKSLRLEAENSKLKSESDDLRGEIETIRAEYAKVRGKYATKRVDYEKIAENSTLDELRAINCERRKRLGYDCPE